MHKGKYQGHMAASCTYHLPTIISLLFNRSQTKRNKSISRKQIYISWGKVRRMDNQQEMTPQKEQEEWTEKQKIGKENRTTALRSQKGGGHH